MRRAGMGPAKAELPWRGPSLNKRQGQASPVGACILRAANVRIGPVPKLPARLQKDSILEAVFELRFQATVPAAAEILQGAIYPALRDRFPKVQRTAFASFPLPLMDTDPNLRYQPRLVLQGDHLSVFVGDRAVALTSARPYVGWKNFRPLILELLGLVKSANVTSEPERFSLKYINLLEGASPAAQFSLVRYDASLGRRYKLNNLLTYTRTEFEQDGLINIVELGANSIAKTQRGQSLTGLVLTVDTIHDNPHGFWANPEPFIEKAHTVEKTVFFEVLTEDTVNSMGPVWE